MALFLPLPPKCLKKAPLDSPGCSDRPWLGDFFSGYILMIPGQMRASSPSLLLHSKERDVAPL
eukprot:scaffold55892_cov12-Tisochrysis_lutea.AAC.1